MKIEYLFFIVYVGMVIWILPKIPFIKHSGLSSRESRLLFSFKILTGILCAFYFEKISTATDYLAYNYDGRLQYELLLSKPGLFFADITNDLKTYGLGGLFEASNNFWANLRSNLLFKFIAILNLLTGGNFYLNSVVFCSMVFFGHIAFYRIYSDIYKGQKFILLFASFCLPSLLFYTSCVHKDGIIFLSIGLISYTLYKLPAGRKNMRFVYILFFFISTLTVFLFRNYLIVALVPAIITAWLSKLVPNKKRSVFLISYSFFFAIFFLSGYFRSSFNLPAAVVKRKADFAGLAEANTDIRMNELYPTLKSFIINLPQAINHFFFRPYLWEFSKPAIFLTALELFFYQIIIITFVFFRKRQVTITNSFNLFGYAFFINMMLIIGYTIPNIGAIVRYRSIFWVFLICPLVCNIDWKRLLSFGSHTAKVS